MLIDSPASALRTHAPYRMALVDALALLANDMTASPVECLIGGLVNATYQTILNSAVRSFATSTHA